MESRRKIMKQGLTDLAIATVSLKIDNDVIDMILPTFETGLLFLDERILYEFLFKCCTHFEKFPSLAEIIRYANSDECKIFHKPDQYFSIMRRMND